MQYTEAVEIFGQNLNVDLSDKRFMLTIVDPEVHDEDILIRLELSFLEDLSELQSGNTGGSFQSIKTGRLSASLFHDWKILTEENGREFLQFCQNWNPEKYYSRGGQRERLLINAGTLYGEMTEFTGPNNTKCAGLIRIRIEGGRLSFNGASSEAKAFIKGLLAKAAPAKAENLLF